MIKANKSPVLTSNNFGINFVELGPELFKKPTGDFDNFSIKNSFIAHFSKCPTFNLAHPISKGIASMRPNAKFKLEILKSSNTPIVVTFKQKASEVVCSGMVVRTNQNVQAKMVVSFFGTQDTSLYSKILFESEENSDLEVIVLTDNGTSFLNIEKHLQKNAKLKILLVDFSSKHSISNVFATLQENSNFDLETLYLSSGLVDQNFLVELWGQKASTNIDVVGALGNGGTKAFKGTIDFKSGAKQASGHEKEFCLLLGDNATSKSLPMLLSGEEDMEGSHSSSSGKVDDEQMFYLLCRGFSEKEAKLALVRAKFQKHIDRIFDERTKNLVLSKIEKEINRGN